MRQLGFRASLSPEMRGYIITSFRCPDHQDWDLDRVYALLGDEGFVIYPGKVGEADCFRIGTIGRIEPSDLRALLCACARTLDAMGIDLKRG